MDHPWLDRAAYPFAHHVLAVDGGRMHYVDEGAGEPIVFVHGTPTWSFLYRHIIRDLRKDYRCIAPDHIGFGLSDKPVGWDYSFAAHGRNLHLLLDHLNLPRFTLVVHDVGGPIGLSYAVAHQERVARLLVMNSFLWPLHDAYALAPPLARKLLVGPCGRWLVLQLNAEARWLLPQVYGDRTKLTPLVHQHYIAPFARPAERHGMWLFAQHMMGGADWCAEVWQQRAALAQLPATIVWGMQDPLFGRQFLARWREALPGAAVVEVAGAGHFVQEEQPTAVVQALRLLLATTPW